jgi:putative hydrolase of the HAD superfamily
VTAAGPAVAIETLIFDLGGVLAHVDGRPLVVELARLSGRPEVQIYAALEQGMQGILLEYERGRSNVVEVHRWALDALGLTPERYPVAHFSRHWCEAIHPDTEMQALFRRCCASPRLRTCVLSNTNDLHWNWVAERHDLLQHAAVTLTSFETGFYKPEPEIYTLALERFGVADPRAALFIDDREENVAAARQAGMERSFVHEGYEATRARLLQLGVAEAGGA